MSASLVTIEVAKVLITGYMTYAKQRGLSDAEMKEIYEEAKKEFAENDPTNLEDV